MMGDNKHQLEWRVGEPYSKELAESNETTRVDTLESLAYSVEEGDFLEDHTTVIIK